MSKQLLNHTLRAYIILSLIVLLVSAPLFYWVTEKLYIDEADETLYLLKDEFLKYNLPAFKISDIPAWNAINRGVKIEAAQTLRKDSVFQAFYLDTLVHENEPYRVLLSKIEIEHEPFVLKVRLNLVESEDMVESIALLFFLVLVLLLTGLFFVTRYLSVRLWQPFYSTLTQIEAFDLDKNTKPVWHVTEVEEFRRLNQSIERLLERNLTVYKSQREFTENAAHELQTPLAVFQAKLDTLAQQVPLTTELSETLSRLAEAASRLARTNKNLLLLSKIDNSQYGDREDIEVATVLKKQLDFFTEQAREKNITIEISILHPLTVNANLSLFEIAISNLMLNAIRHNVPDGNLGIVLDGKTLMLSNTGYPQPLVTDKLFQRFSTQGEKGGSGLGLSIVKKIAGIHSWSITYSYEKHLHVFHLQF